MGTGGREGTAAARQAPMEDEFTSMRKHVRRMQQGTPLLMRAIGGGGSNQEELQICTFWISPDLSTLKWRDQEGSGDEYAVPISAIADVQEEPSVNQALPGMEGGEDAEEDHFALTLVLRKQPGKQVPALMTLIFASPEDLTTWHEGLTVLAQAPGSQPRPPASMTEEALKSPSASAGPSALGSRAPSAQPSPAGKTTTTPTFTARPVTRQEEERIEQQLATQRSRERAETEELRQALRMQTELSEKLEKENEMLKQVVQRKDETIATLMRDSQKHAVATDRYNKTESTSRESDNHLRDREEAMLRRKNQKLKQALRAKQQTVKELLKVVAQVTQQQGGESSAYEGGHDAEDLLFSDEEEVAAGPARSPAAAAQAARSPARPAQAPAAQEDEESEEEGEEDEDDEVGVLAGQLAALEQEVEQSLSRRDGKFAPPPRVQPQGSAAQPAAAGGGFARGGRQPAAGGVGSAAALQALQRELDLLEEKKRVVEELARQLEPPSDAEVEAEEDDGFPLR